MSLFNSSSRRPWHTVRVLGRGSYGVVYLAIHAKHNGNGLIRQRIAVKTALLENAFSLIKEKRIYGVFRDCPEIAHCYYSQITVEGGLMHYNLVLEYAPGGTLEDVIGLGLPENDVRVYTRTILRGLRCMHEKGYVHCDVKPSNILAFPSDHRQGDDSAAAAYRLKLADLGTAKEPEEDVPREKLVGKFRVTPHYSPPEVAGSGIVLPASDIWSLGCTVVEMICGCNSLWPEYEHLSAEEFACRLVGSSSLTPKIPPLMSEDGKDFLRKCFQRDPRDRWTAEMLLGHPYVNGLNSDASVLNSSLQWDYPDNYLPQLVQGCVCTIL